MNDNFKQVIKSLEESKKLAQNKADSSQQQELLVKSVGALQTAIVESMKVLANSMLGGTINVNDKSNKGTLRTPDAIVAAETVKGAIDLVSKNIANLDAIVIKKELDITPIVEGLKSLDTAISKLPTTLPTIPAMPKDMAINNLDLVVKAIAQMNKQLQSIEFNPNIKVASPIVNVDLSADLKRLEKAIKEIKPTLTMPDMPSFDTSKLEAEVVKVTESINNLTFPVPNIKPSYLDQNGAGTAVTLTSTGRVPVELGTNPTIDIGDVQVKNASGTVINPSTEEKQDALISAVDDLTTSQAQTDVFNQLVGATRYNQVEIDYSTTAPASITDITVTTTSGGSSSNSNGQAVFSTGTSATGGIKAVTNTSITYRPHAESYAAFSAIFTTGVANSYQRIGIYDTNNGFFIGYEGTSFGVTVRRSTTDTTVDKASFNVDTLSGQSGSKYTRNGVAEALDPTKDNLYRIRFGWLGASGIFFEVLSPDQEWVTFHIHRVINTAIIPSIANPNLPITLDARKTSGATNLVMNTACWAAGSTSILQKITTTLTDNTLASLNRSVITGQTTGGGGGYVNVKVNPSGALTVENTPATSGTGTVSTASVTTANTTVLASNGSRKGATIYNEGTVTALVKLGSTASTTSYTIKMAVDGYYEVPFGFTGIITGITASGTATLRVTELT
jgi:hypothetical protein